MVIPKFTPRFTDVLEGFAGLTSHYSQATVYYSKGIKSRINKGKRYIKQKLEDTRYKLPRVLSQGSHTEHTKPPSNELQKHMQNVFCQGSLLEPKSPGFLLG